MGFDVRAFPSVLAATKNEASNGIKSTDPKTIDFKATSDAYAGVACADSNGGEDASAIDVTAAFSGAYYRLQVG